MTHKTVINICLALIALCWPVTLTAQTATIGGIDYSLNTTDMTAAVTGGNVSGDIVIPGEITVDEVAYAVKVIVYMAFYGNDSITSVSMPQVTSVGEYAFYNCTNLTSADMPQVTSVGDQAFYNCTSLTSADMPQVTTIGNIAFCGCKNLTSADMPQVTNIGNNAFEGCKITKLSLPASLKSIGNYCFNYIREITLDATTPPTLGSSVFWEYATIKVPESAVDAYKAAETWSTYKSRILSVGDITDYDVTATAQEKESGMLNAIGQDNLDKVVSLKVTGTINGYDIMVIRNKMPNLHYLDLTNTDIVANDYEYYTGYHTEDNVIGGYMFYNLGKLFSLKLPDSAVNTDNCIAENCINLREVVLPSKLENIGCQSFHLCPFTNIDLPPTIKTIADYGFASSGLSAVSLPMAIEDIGYYAFENCYGLTEIKIPSAIKSIGDNAFYLCNLKRVYTYTVEPININQNTFSDYTTATLYIPKQSSSNYYWNTEWSQFTTLEEFDEPYTYFYLNKEFTLDDRFTGEPDIDVNPGGGFIVTEDTEKGDQDADDIHIKGDGMNWASIIANANLNAKGLYVDITVQANKWYFLSFPFKVKRSDISCGGEAKFVFRSYDGEIRAEKGSGGWVDIDDSEEYLQPFKGYIFQASLDCTLSMKIEKSEFGKLPNVDVDTKLDFHASDNEQNASWNFAGNQFTAWYDIDDMGYDCPITRWNSDTNTYEAVRPGDDTAFLHPFEAFFVQRPNDSDGINFGGDNRLTQTGKDKKETAKQQRARAHGTFDVSRQTINLTLSDGTVTDKTRVVFNPKKQNAYEKDCDAAKFEGGASAELYTVEAQAGRLAINERPEGSVQLGYRAAKTGEYTIAALRMDRPVLLYDNVMKTTVDLTQGDYRFTSEAGRHDSRFMLMPDNSTTGIGDIVETTGVNVKPTDCGINISNLQGKVLRVYNTDGALFATRNADGFLNLSKGVYLVEVDGMKAKFMVR